MPPVYCERCDRRCRTVFDCVRKCGATLCSNRCADEHEADCRHDPKPDGLLVKGLIIACVVAFGIGMAFFFGKLNDRFEEITDPPPRRR